MKTQIKEEEKHQGIVYFNTTTKVQKEETKLR